MSQAVDVAEYDGQAALARLRGHVASALEYVREQERASSTSTGSTGTVQLVLYSPTRDSP